MTCIAGYTYEHGVVLGADSAGVGGNYSLTIRKDAKIFRAGKNDEFIIGCTSSFRMIQLLRFSFNPPKINKEIYEYMCTDFIDKVRECFKKGGFLEKDKEVESGGDFLVGYKNRLFRISSDYQVGESTEGFDAVGCGASYAIGAIHILKESTPYIFPEIIINKALKVAEKCSAGVRGPFNILSYNEDQIKK